MAVPGAFTARRTAAEGGGRDAWGRTIRDLLILFGYERVGEKSSRLGSSRCFSFGLWFCFGNGEEEQSRAILA